MRNSTPASLQLLIKKSQLRKYPKGQIILYEGDQPSHVFHLRKGFMKIYDIDNNGNEKILHIAGPGDIFPLLHAFDAIDELFSFYSTLTDVEVNHIPRQEFLDHLNKNSDLSIYCLRWFSGEVRDMLIRMSSMERSDSKVKLLTALEYLARRHSIPKKDGWVVVNFPITQQFVADMTGITRESANLAFQEFQKEKLIKSPRSQVMELHFDKLKKLTSNGN